MTTFARLLLFATAAGLLLGTPACSPPPPPPAETDPDPTPQEVPLPPATDRDPALQEEPPLPAEAQPDVPAPPVADEEDFPRDVTLNLVFLRGQQFPLPEGQRTPSLIFLSEDNQVHGFAGVNQLNGTYTLEDNRLTFGPLAMTRMAGSPEAMALEQRFSAALEEITAWRLDGTTLELLAGTTPMARFEPAPSQD